MKLSNDAAVGCSQKHNNDAWPMEYNGGIQLGSESE